MTASESDGAALIAAYVRKVKQLQSFTGEGMMSCRKALDACDGDVLLAVGHIKYQGSLVNLRGGSTADWLKARAEGYKAELMLDEHGEIQYTR